MRLQIMKTKPSRWCLAFAAAGGILLSGAGPLQAQTVEDLPFDSGSTGADGALSAFFSPLPAHSRHVMAYDAARQEMVVFRTNTWKWAGTDWMMDTGPTPPERQFSVMAYDEARREVVLFGGGTWNSDFNDTWTWDGTSWSNRTAQEITAFNTPTARQYSAMAFDSARGVILLFGGYLTGDTWAWNGSAWTQVANSGPAARWGHTLAYDRDRQRIVLFGGATDRNGYSLLRETWEWDGSNWTNLTLPSVNDSNTPPARNGGAMAYDAKRGRTVLFGGYSYSASRGITMLRDTWEWDGTNWFNRTSLSFSTANTPSARDYAAMAYDGARQRIVLCGGEVSPGSSETWLWNGDTWQQSSGEVFYFDMASRTDGAWNFSTIHVPLGITVKFAPNEQNTPVRWLATGDVLIEGTIDVSGESGGEYTPTTGAAPGGPGGFAGGRGGLAINQSGSASGTPGEGPGGGNPGTASSSAGEPGRFAGAYGNPYLQPLIGGSGGGGGQSLETDDGFNGGGGGGALMISSSRDIWVNGAILANGGAGADTLFGSGRAGGNGSGGAILLRADRISGSGLVRALGQGQPGTEGRIRLEAYYRPLANATAPTSVNSVPVLDRALTNNATLRIVSVDGVPVPNSPGGNTLVPDVIFTNPNPVNILVSANSIPDNTAIRLRVTTALGIIHATNVLSGDSATFRVPVPPGIGTVQAFAEFQIGN